MIKNLRRRILEVSYPILKKVGKIHAPFSHKFIEQQDVEALMETLRPGDLLLARNRSEFTNLIISGFYKHLGVYVGDGQIVEAVDPSVQSVGIYDFAMTKDYIVVVRSKTATEYEKIKAVKAAKDFIGRSYDYGFYIPSIELPNHSQYIKSENHAFYCAELGYWCYRIAQPGMAFKLRDVLGVPTVAPQDFVDAAKHWQVVFESCAAR